MKKQQITALLVMALLFMGILQANAQSDSIPVTGAGETSWQLVKSNNDVKVFAKEALCIDAVNGISMKKVLFRLENQTSQAVVVDWDNRLYYNNVCSDCNEPSSENHVRIALSPSEVKEASCTGNDRLTIYISMIGLSNEQLNSFELINFTTLK